MKKAAKGEFRSAVYTNRPDYADFDAPHKFMAIQSIVGKRLIEHPNAICSYSGGSDSDIMIDVIERARDLFRLPPIKYVFFNTGLEMKATKDHVKATAQKYGVEIEEVRPKINIVQAVKRCGIPLLDKIASEYLGRWQKCPFPLSSAEEYEKSIDKPKKLRELVCRYGCSKTAMMYVCSCDPNGKPIRSNQFAINNHRYLLEYMREDPPKFRISARCCDYCKKQVAHEIQKDFEMVITGERCDEGGIRSVPRSDEANSARCFAETASGQYRLRPLYYVSNADKRWYKCYYGIRYSDAYEVYGLTRTGCCGCPISYKAVDDLELIGRYEPNLAKAAWSIFGDSYRYRQQYNRYKAQRDADAKQIDGQMSIKDFLGGENN